MATFNTRISLKYDTYANWHANNPVLLKGELAIVEVPASTGVAQNEPTYLLKVGNGTDHFDDLKWISHPKSLFTSLNGLNFSPAQRSISSCIRRK